MLEKGIAARADFAQDCEAAAKLFDASAKGHDRARLFTKWRQQPPSMPALLAVAAAKLSLPPDEPALVAAMLAGMAADMPATNPYHNNAHFREVTSMMALYALEHKNIADAGQAGVMALGARDLAKCLLAAAAHDLAHDGTGNTVDGMHYPFRLEDRAIGVVTPLMEKAGLSPADCRDVQVMIRTTDISGLVAPHKVLRKLMAGEDIEVSAELDALKGDRRLQQMAALLSDADLAPSASLCYAFAIASTRALNRENPSLAPTDKSLKGFLDFIVESRFCSPAAQSVSQADLDLLQHKIAGRISRAEVRQAPKP